MQGNGRHRVEIVIEEVGVGVECEPDGDLFVGCHQQLDAVAVGELLRVWLTTVNHTLPGLPPPFGCGARRTSRQVLPGSRVCPITSGAVHLRGRTWQAWNSASLRTGDLGVLDADGYVNMTGCIKDMVIRGGENIYPRRSRRS